MKQNTNILYSGQPVLVNSATMTTFDGMLARRVSLQARIIFQDGSDAWVPWNDLKILLEPVPFIVKKIKKP